MKESSYHHGDLRNALIEASIRLMAVEGVHNLSLRKVAALAGVSSGAPYRHFACREALLAAVAEEGFEKLTCKVELTQLECTGSRRKLLIESAGAYVDFAIENPDYLRLMFGSEILDRNAYPALAEASQKSFRQLLKITTSLRKSGFLSRRLKAETAALTLWSIIHGLSVLFIEGQLLKRHTTMQKRALTRSLISTVLRGLV